MMRVLKQLFTPRQAPASQDELDQPLLFFGDEALTLRACCEGIFITGSSGSGKTTGSGAAIAKAYLRNGFGGLVTCCKPDEPEVWRRYARETAASTTWYFLGHAIRTGSIILTSPPSSRRATSAPLKISRNCSALSSRSPTAGKQQIPKTRTGRARRSN